MDELLQALDQSLTEFRSMALVIGLSGGVDSVTLLETCWRWREEQANPPTLIAAHLNHQLRDGADDDETFCRDLCRQRDIDFVSKTVDVRASAKERACGLEEAGRQERHVFFADVCLAHAPSVLLLAHHADDQAETVLMRMNRGLHLRGLSGMQTETRFTLDDGRTLTILRPFLSLWKADLRRTADATGLIWHEDETNRNSDNPRNHIRNQMLPLLKSILPGFPEAILALADLASGAESVLDKVARDVYDAHVTSVDAGVLLAAGSVDATRDNPQLLRHVLRQILEETFTMPDLAGAHLLALDRLLRRGRTGSHLQLPGALRARKESDGLYIYHAEDEPLPPDGELILPMAPFRLEAFGVRVSATLHAPPHAIPQQDQTDPQVEWIDAAAVRKPLNLRARRNGDRLWPLGASGGKKVKDILIDRKVPQREKASVRILADYAGVLWLWPICLANRARLSDSTRSAIRIRIEPVTPS